MPQVRVKAGFRYRYAGHEYSGGEAVAGVPEKFLRVLTGPKGPLEYALAPTYKTKVMKAKPKPEPQPAPEPTVPLDEPQPAPEPTVPLDEAPQLAPGTYARRDLTAED